MAEEIKDLRRLLETQLASFAWNDLNRRAPVRARLLRELHKLGVDTALAAELADDVPPRSTRAKVCGCSCGGSASACRS